jgi:hypothetical protein
LYSCNMRLMWASVLLCGVVVGAVPAALVLPQDTAAAVSEARALQLEAMTEAALEEEEDVADLADLADLERQGETIIIRPGGGSGANNFMDRERRWRRWMRRGRWWRRRRRQRWMRRRPWWMRNRPWWRREQRQPMTIIVMPGQDQAMEDEALRDESMWNEAMEDEAMEDEAMEDEAMEDEAAMRAV